MSPLRRAASAVRLPAIALFALALVAAASYAPAASGSVKLPYTTKRSGYREHATFVVSYRGLASWSTTYHATPPNEGGDPDTNDARDWSGQAWSLLFSQKVTLEPCGRRADGSDRCTAVGDLNGATGATIAVGQIDHVHVDGLYRQLDRTVRCDVRTQTPAGANLTATIGLRYYPQTKKIAVTAYNPLFDVLNLLPSACPGQGDGIDRIYDNYYTPGFSFAPMYGADRWFRSRPIVIAANVVHHSTRITIPLSATPAGTPPRDCSVRDPSFERCSTGGLWFGILTFKAP